MSLPSWAPVMLGGVALVVSTIAPTAEGKIGCCILACAMYLLAIYVRLGEPRP